MNGARWPLPEAGFWAEYLLLTMLHCSICICLHCAAATLAAHRQCKQQRISCNPWCSGNVLELLEDIQELRPTIFSSVPRLWNRIYDKVMAQASCRLCRFCAVCGPTFGPTCPWNMRL